MNTLRLDHDADAAPVDRRRNTGPGPHRKSRERRHTNIVVALWMAAGLVIAAVSVAVEAG